MLRPLFNQVVIRPERDAAPSLIESPATAERRHDRGVVISTGSGYRSAKTGEITPLCVKAGDRVLYAPFGGEDHDIDGVTHRIIPEEHIFAVLD